MSLRIVANLKDGKFHSLSLLLEFLIEVSCSCICISCPEIVWLVREVSLTIFSSYKTWKCFHQSLGKMDLVKMVWPSNALYTLWFAAPVPQTKLKVEVCVFRDNFSSVIIQGFPNYMFLHTCNHCWYDSTIIINTILATFHHSHLIFIMPPWFAYFVQTHYSKIS